MRPIYKFVSEDTGLITKTVNGFIPETVVIPLKKSSQDEIEILVKLGDGNASAEAYGCDLTYDYVKINGDYRT